MPQYEHSVAGGGQGPAAAAPALLCKPQACLALLLQVTVLNADNAFILDHVDHTSLLGACVQRRCWALRCLAGLHGMEGAVPAGRPTQAQTSNATAGCSDGCGPACCPPCRRDGGVDGVVRAARRRAAAPPRPPRRAAFGLALGIGGTLPPGCPILPRLGGHQWRPAKRLQRRVGPRLGHPLGRRPPGQPLHGPRHRRRQPPVCLRRQHRRGCVHARLGGGREPCCSQRWRRRAGSPCLSAHPAHTSLPHPAAWVVCARLGHHALQCAPVGSHIGAVAGRRIQRLRPVAAGLRGGVRARLLWKLLGGAPGRRGGMGG